MHREYAFPPMLASMLLDAAIGGKAPDICCAAISYAGRKFVNTCVLVQLDASQNIRG